MKKDAGKPPYIPQDAWERLGAFEQIIATIHYNAWAKAHLGTLNIQETARLAYKEDA